MQRLSKRMLGTAVLGALLAGCTTVQLSGPTEQPAVEQVQVNPHWRFDDSRAAADQDGYRPPSRLAVLLPMTGALATAAAPVRDGLLAGYYGERRTRPEIVFYDTLGTAAGAVAAHARAVSEGADQVLGPLGRDEVSAVFQSPQAVPTLALNRGASAPAENGASYSLAPEDEGDAAAAYLLSRNARRVLVLSNGDDNAQRSIEALRARLLVGGGAIVGTVAVVGDKPADSTPAFRNAASGENAADAVFLAIRGNQARIVVSQLAAAGLGGKLRVATSQIGQGIGKPEEDLVLDGIAFTSEPWASGTAHASLPAAAALGRDLPTARGPATRLFAFGHDAWQLSAYLQYLATHPDAQLKGATGTLRLDADGTVRRAPAWATFSRGNVVPLTGG
ncbi:penicillin-binding protein activator [Luteimonas sp. RIT-PG2_3]